MSDDQRVLCDIDGQVALLTLNKPAQRNAICIRLLAELREHLFRLAGDDAVRVIALTGAGKGFCAGADLSDTTGFASGEEGIEGHYKPVFMELVTIRKPVIACVNGAAAGAGMALAMCCDLLVMSEDAYMKLAFSELGLVPDCGMNWLLPRVVGYSKAYEMAIEAQRINAEDCLRYGLANRVVAADDALEQTLQWAGQLAGRAPLAMGWTKKLMRDASMQAYPETFSAEGSVQDTCLGSADFREGFKAFFEKREPVFRGE